MTPFTNKATLHRKVQLEVPLEHVFFSGDIQGSYDNFMASLTAAGFSASEGHQVFAVGDLIDGNIDGKKCIDLLDEPWFHSVRGNHEIYMLKACENITLDTLAKVASGLATISDKADEATLINLLKNVDLSESIPSMSREMQFWLSAGGLWFFHNKSTPEQQMALIQRLRAYLGDGTLPVTLTVECQGETFGLAHSWLPGLKWSTVTRSPMGLKRIGSKILTSRQLFKEVERYPNNHPNYRHNELSAMILGHCVCPDKTPIMKGNTLFLDTGSKRGGTPTIWRATEVLKSVQK